MTIPVIALRLLLLPRAVAWARYGWEFDASARLGDLHIDFETLAQLLTAVAKQSPRHGGDLDAPSGVVPS